MPRTVKPDAMVNLIPADMAMRDLAAERFCGMVPAVNCENLKRLTDEGYLEFYGVEHDGRTVFVVWVNVTTDRALYVNAAMQVNQDSPGFEVLVKAIEKLARQRGCLEVIFATQRAGLIQRAKAYGYKPQAVLIRKTL